MPSSALCKAPGSVVERSILLSLALIVSTIVTTLAEELLFRVRSIKQAIRNVRLERASWRKGLDDSN